MMTVHEVSRYTGVTVRALQYYDRIGLLSPAERTPAGYRLYDEGSLERLQQILLFRELGFSLDDIRRILDSPDFDRDRALTQQIELLTLKKEQLEKMISLAGEIRRNGGRYMDFSAFDRTKLTEYAARAKESWGDTDAYREYEARAEGRTEAQEQEQGRELMALFAEFGAMRDLPADAPAVQAQVKKLQDFITGHYYRCTDEILRGLGAMYDAGGEFTENIDAAGGPGTASFVHRAIRARFDK